MSEMSLETKLDLVEIELLVIRKQLAALDLKLSILATNLGVSNG